MRRDGGALVIVVQVADQTARLAIWETSTGGLRWLTPSEPGVRYFSPVWSPAGDLIYVGRISKRSNGFDTSDVFRVRSDGSRLEDIGMSAGLPPVKTPIAVSAGGRLYVQYTWEYDRLEQRDLASGAQREFEWSHFDAIRERQPGALLQGSATGIFPSAGLAILDDQTGDRRDLLPYSTEVAGADWDPTGTRIVAAVRTRQSQDPWVLISIDDRGGTRRAIAGSAGAGCPRWVQEGVLYLRADVVDWQRVDNPYPGGQDFDLFPTLQPPFELRLVNPATAESRVILRSDTEFSFAVVGG